MKKPVAASDRFRRPVRRRERELEGPRTIRIKISYNEAELAIINEAALRDNVAMAAWAARAALGVAKDKLVPVSMDAKQVLQELIKSRGQLRSVGNDLGQVAHTLTVDGTVTAEQLDEVLAHVNEAVKRVDAATLQLMRERRSRL